MMGSIMKNILIILIVFFFNNSFAQLSVSVSAGFDIKEISLYEQTVTDGNNAFWNGGITLGINCDYSLSENLFISALFHYSHYKYDKYVASGFRIPEIIFISANGEDSKLIRTSVELKYFPFPQNRIKFFVFSGLGLVIEDLGIIRTRFLDMIQGTDKTYSINSEIENTLVHSLGLGFQVDLISNFFVDISGSYYSNYSDRFQTLIGASIGYKIF